MSCGCTGNGGLRWRLGVLLEGVLGVALDWLLDKPNVRDLGVS